MQLLESLLSLVQNTESEERGERENASDDEVELADDENDLVAILTDASAL